MRRELIEVGEDRRPKPGGDLGLRQHMSSVALGNDCVAACRGYRQGIDTEDVGAPLRDPPQGSTLDVSADP